MEVISDAKFKIIETENLIVKNIESYTINIDTKLLDNFSGTLYLINSSSNNIIIYLPYRKKGINFEFIFNNTNNNSIEFRTDNTDISLIDNSKIIGTDWLYLKRSNIDISYSNLTGSIIKFNKSEKGEHIKFFCDGDNYYIINKNDTNNNINNILINYPSQNSSNYIVNINLNNTGEYIYNIINEITNENIKEIFMGTNNIFKFNTTSIEYNNITKISNEIILNLYTYIDYYDTIMYNFDNPTSLIKYKYKYPVFNYKLINSLGTELKTLNVFNTKYVLNLLNNSILYPGYLYNNLINNDTNDTGILLSNTSILYINYESINNNIIIYNEFGTELYNHNKNRKFLLVNRDIKYSLIYTLNNIFNINITSTITQITTYTSHTFFRFSSSLIVESNTLSPNLNNIDTISTNNNLYFLNFKNIETNEIFKIPLLILDQLLLEPSSNSQIIIENKLQNALPKINGIISYNYVFNITTNIILDKLELTFLNTKQTTDQIEENIFKLMSNKLKISIEKDNIDNYLLKFSDNYNNIYNTTITTEGIYRKYEINTVYNILNNITINYYSLLNNITGGTFKLSPFIINDEYSGKVILLNLKKKLIINLENNTNGNYYDLMVEEDNSIDNNIYILLKQQNSIGFDEYYFIKNNDYTNPLKNIDLYSSNKYEIVVENSILSNEVTISAIKTNDLIQFSDIKDGIMNFRKTENYNFISKKINSNNTVSYIFDIPEQQIPEKLYYFNRNIRNMGGIINILSIEKNLQNIQINSIYPFTTKYKIFVNNISYEKKTSNYMLTLRNLRKGDTIKLYYHYNNVIIKDYNFYNDNDNIIKYPENIVSSNILDTKIVLNGTNYDITFNDENKNVINYLSSGFRFIKNQIYYLNQTDYSNYKLNNIDNKNLYIKIINNNEQFLYEYYNDSKFTIKNNDILLYRTIIYNFKQFDKSNANPGINLDLKKIFKITVKKNSSNINKFYVNDLETYTLDIIPNTTYYFDLSDILLYKFKLSLFEDGINNSTLNEYKTTEVEYTTIRYNNIDYVNLIKLKLNETTTLTKLYYFSGIETLRNLGGLININNGLINYKISIIENKTYNLTTNLNYYKQKYEPKYKIKIKNEQNILTNNPVFYKDNKLPSLKLKLIMDNTIYDKIYNTDLYNISAIDIDIINIYIKCNYNDNYPRLSYFTFYTDINFVQQITLPLTLLKNRKYKFQQPNYNSDQFKFYMFIFQESNDYVNNLNNTNLYDTDLFTYYNNNGFTIDTTQFFTSYLYYSGIHYINSTQLYNGSVISKLNNNIKLIEKYNIYIIPDKEIYLSDNINNNTDKIHITSSQNILNKNITIIQEDLYNNNILNNIETYFYLQNNYTLDKTITLSILLNNTKYKCLDKYNLNDLYISVGSNYEYNKWNNFKNKFININSNLNYNISLSNSIYNLCYYDNGLKDIYYNSTVTTLNIQNEYIYDYFIHNTETPIYNRPYLYIKIKYNNGYELDNILQKTVTYYKNYTGQSGYSLVIYFDLSDSSIITPTNFNISTTNDGTNNSGVALTPSEGVVYDSDNQILSFTPTVVNTYYYYMSGISNNGGIINIIDKHLIEFSNFQPSSLTNSSLENNYYNINFDFDENIYEYLIRIKSDVTSFKIIFNAINNNTLHSINIYDNSSSSISFNSENNITINNDNIKFVDVCVLKNSQTYIYKLKFIKENTKYKYIVDFGKLIVNNFEITNDENSKKNLYLSQPIKFQVSDIENINLPNMDLINTYTLELLYTNYSKAGNTGKQFSTYNYFVINNNYYNIVKNTDNVIKQNIFSNNLYITDFRTIILDISHTSLINTDITFYTDEIGETKLSNNIIYTGEPGETNSKLLLNINPNLNGILFYYSKCIFKTDFIHDMLIKTSNIELITTDLSIYGNIKKYKCSINIIPFIKNKLDFYYDIYLTNSFINLDRFCFILYNSNNIYKGHIITDKFENSTITSPSSDYKYNVYLVFDNLKLYNNSEYSNEKIINIDKTYKLKLYEYEGGKIITPNYIHFDKLNKYESTETTIFNNNIIYNNSSTEDSYLMNNKNIDSTKYLYRDNNNDENYYISSNSYENFKINDTTIINNNYKLSNSVIKYNTTTKLNINDTPGSSFKFYTRLNNELQFIDFTNNIEQKTTNSISINCFDIIPKIYDTRIDNITTNDKTFYKSLTLNINGIDNVLLILKPYHSYTFNIKNIWIKTKIETNISSTYKKYYLFDDSLGEINYPKLSIVNIEDSSELISSVTGTLTINIPYNSTLYNIYDKLYLKVSGKIRDINDVTDNYFKQGFYNREYEQINNSNSFVQYIPILVDKKSVINTVVEYKNNNYYINNYIDSLNIFNNYTYIFDLSNINLINKLFNINVTNNNTNNIETNNSHKILNNIIGNNGAKLLININKNHSISITTSKTIYLENTKTELNKINITDSLVDSILLLNRTYVGNDSSNDYINLIQQKYQLKYIGEPGYNGELIYNINKILDFNININNKKQNKIYINYNTYKNTKVLLQQYLIKLFKTSNFTIYEPIKLKLQYVVNTTTGATNVDLPFYSYSTDYFPGKTESQLQLQIPKDIDNDNIFNETLKISGVGIYSDEILTNINILTLLSDIFTLQQQNSTIFLNIKNNIIIRLPIPNNSFIYKFIITNVEKNTQTNIPYTVTFTSTHNIYGYIDRTLNKNIELNYNKTLIFKNSVKGNSFTITSNNENYYLDNISIERIIDNVSIINYNKHLLYIPSIEVNTIDVNVTEENFILTKTTRDFDNKIILYKDIKYKFDTLNLLVNEFSINNTNVLNPTNIDISTSILLNNYNMLYYSLKINTITNSLFSTFINDKHLIKYSVIYNSNTDTILFNNLTNPIIYSNYIYDFNITNLSGFYILYNYNFTSNNDTNINNNKFVSINKQVNNIYLCLNNIVKQTHNSIEVTSCNNIDSHKLMYIYYKPIKIDTGVNILIIREYISGVIDVNYTDINITISTLDFDIYSFIINDSNVLTNILVDKLNLLLSNYDYILSINKDIFQLTHTSKTFKIIENSLSKLFGFETSLSVNNICKGVIPHVKNILEVKNYYSYYGDKLYLDYYTLNSINSSSIISIDLVEDKHINLPTIKDGLTYTFIINETINNKSLYIHSDKKIYYSFTSFKEGNILVLYPNLNSNLKTGSSITIISNNEKYFVSEINGFTNIDFYYTQIYNKTHNFSNLYYTKLGISNIDKYISIFGTHIIGLSTTTNKLLNEKKFIHVAKVLAKLLDYDEDTNSYDDNIVNSIQYNNSYILLYETTIPNDYFVIDKHLNNINIKYDDINLDYDFNYKISSINVYDKTVELLLNFIIKTYIYAYPHIFKYDLIPSLENYKYIKNGKVSNISIEDLRESANKSSINILNKYYDINNIINSNYCIGTGITIRINILNTIYISNHTIQSYNIEIINNGIGYKNGDIIKVKLENNLFVNITLESINSSSDYYTVKNAHNEIYFKNINKNILNESINTVLDNIYPVNYGNITLTDTIDITSIKINDIIYTKNLDNDNDVVIYVTHLLLGLLNFYKKRFIINDINTNVIYSKLITPTLIKHYNKNFIGLYFTTTLSKIKSLNNIYTYDLNKLGYKNSDNSKLYNLELFISEQSKVDFNILTNIYNNIIFDNYLKFKLYPNNQFSTFKTKAYSILNTIETELSVYDSTTIEPIIDVSNIIATDYNTKKLKVSLDVISEDGQNTNNYIIESTRNNTLSENVVIDKLISKTIENTKTKIIETLNNVNDITKIYTINYVKPISLEILPYNIYSTIEFTLLNGTQTLITKNNLKEIYNIIPGNSDKINIQIKIIPEKTTITDKIYNLILNRLPNNIALIDNIIITGINNYDKFDKYNNNYSGVLKKYSDNIIKQPINISIKKTDIFSSVITVVEFYNKTTETYELLDIYNTDNITLLNNIIEVYFNTDNKYVINNKVQPKLILFNNIKYKFNLNDKSLNSGTEGQRLMIYKKDSGNNYVEYSSQLVFHLLEHNTTNNNSNLESEYKTGFKNYNKRGLTITNIPTNNPSLDNQRQKLFYASLETTTDRTEIDIVNTDLLRIKIKVTSENKLIANEYIYNINFNTIGTLAPTNLSDLY
jgi:hypothetical protein